MPQPAPSEHNPLQGFLELIGDGLPPQLLGPLEVSALIGRLVARLANEAQPAGSDMTANDFDVLAALATRGPPNRANSTELAAWAGVSNPAITGRVDRLEARGLVERSIDTEDRRVRWITLTEAGKQLLRDQARHVADRPLFADLQKLTKKECATLAALLRKIT